jgi:hypothetical protein
MPREQEIVLSDAELEQIQRAAEVRGISLQEAANEFIREALERRFRQRTGRAPAKVYDLSTRRRQ